jgi:hypothetical protein
MSIGFEKVSKRRLKKIHWPKTLETSIYTFTSSPKSSFMREKLGTGKTKPVLGCVRLLGLPGYSGTLFALKVPKRVLDVIEQNLNVHGLEKIPEKQATEAKKTKPKEDAEINCRRIGHKSSKVLRVHLPGVLLLPHLVQFFLVFTARVDRLGALVILCLTHERSDMACHLALLKSHGVEETSEWSLEHYQLAVACQPKGLQHHQGTCWPEKRYEFACNVPNESIVSFVCWFCFSWVRGEWPVGGPG